MADRFGDDHKRHDVWRNILSTNVMFDNLLFDENQLSDPLILPFPHQNLGQYVKPVRESHLHRCGAERDNNDNNLKVPSNPPSNHAPTQPSNEGAPLNKKRKITLPKNISRMVVEPASFCHFGWFGMPKTDSSRWNDSGCFKKIDFRPNGVLSVTFTNTQIVL